MQVSALTLGQVRAANKDIFLEVGIENCTKEPLYVEYVKMIPSAQYLQSPIEATEIISEQRKEQSNTENDLIETMGNLSLGDHSSDDILRSD